MNLGDLILTIGNKIRNARIAYWKAKIQQKKEIRKYIEQLEKERLELIKSVPFALSEGTTSQKYYLVINGNYYIEIDKKTFKKLKARLNENDK